MEALKNIDLSNINYQNIKSNKPFLIIIGSVLLVFVITIVYSVYKYIIQMTKLNPYLIGKKAKAFYHKQYDSAKSEKGRVNPYIYSEDEVLKETGWKGNNYTYTWWMRIDDLEYNYGKPKHVFHKGPRDGSTMNPGVYLHPTDNSMMIKVDTLGRLTNVNTTGTGKVCQNWTSNTPQNNEFIEFNKYPLADLGDHNFCRNPNNDSQGAWCYTLDKNLPKDYCRDPDGGQLNYTKVPSMKPVSYKLGKEYNDNESLVVKDIPLQRWNHFALVIHGKTLDIYMNGKIVKSKKFMSPVKPNGDQVHMFDNGGFGGEVSKLRFYPKDLSPGEIYVIYGGGSNGGAESFDYAAALTKLKSSLPDIDIGFHASVGINGHKIAIPETSFSAGGDGANISVGDIANLSVGGDSYAGLSLGNSSVSLGGGGSG